MEYFRYILDRRTFKLINNGVFCVNKVKNASTSNVISSIKSILARDILQLHPEVEDDVNMFLKVGHGVVGVSSGCKVLSNVSNRNKHYRVTGCLGNATDTFTNAGNITLSASYDHITEAMMESCLKFFEAGTGFYVRSLVHDLGIALASAACVTDCVRTQQGPFLLGDCLHQEHWNLENILASMMATKFQHKQLFNVLPAREITNVYTNVRVTY
ncbi:hypothetical protein M8J75_013313 [Diaphorina citri]|nr:hypothetical protein M8J75_013313 [Diaphorina citri]